MIFTPHRAATVSGMRESLEEKVAWTAARFADYLSTLEKRDRELDALGRKQEKRDGSSKR